MPTDERHGAHVHHAGAEIARPAHHDNHDRGDTGLQGADADDRLKRRSEQDPDDGISSRAEIQLIMVDLQEPPDQPRHLAALGSRPEQAPSSETTSGLHQQCATGRPQASRLG
jgi:hypothetical protein